MDRVIAGVDLQDQRRLGTDRGGEIAQMGAVGGTDLAQPRAGALHDVGQAERAADLDQLAARDDRLAPGRQRVQCQHQRAGIVVDRERRLGAGQAHEPGGDMVVALAAPAAVEIVFQRRRRLHRLGRRSNRLLRQRRAAEIGMQHGAGQVEDAALRGPRQLRELFGTSREDRLGRRATAAAAVFRQRVADDSNNERAAMAFDQRRGARRAQHPVHRGQCRPAGANRGGRVHEFAAAGSGVSSSGTHPGSSRIRGLSPLAGTTIPIMAAR